MFETLKQATLKDPTIAWRMQFVSLKVGLQTDGLAAQTLIIGPADITLCDGLADDCDLTFKSNKQAWENFMHVQPRVGFQSLASMCETDNLDIITSDIVVFSRYSMLLEKLFATLRPVTQAKPAAIEAPYIDDIQGRYLNIMIGGHRQRIYFEEAGQGQVLLCLHTAGSDGRQYRDILRDPDITKTHRVIAFDLPMHGKSAPPAGFETQSYMLTTDAYVDTIMAVKKALKLDKPIVMGCSIGGRVVLHLALRHGYEFKAAIGLQSAMYAHSHMGEKLAGLQEAGTLYRPDIHGGETAAASVMQLMSPSAPSHHYWETLWYYMQGGPGVFMGDLFYYFVDGDMRNGLIDGIDTDTCPIYLLTGEYDLSATPEMTQELAKAIKPQHCEIMQGLGHFPMSEDPEKFKSYLKPVLDKITRQ